MQQGRATGPCNGAIGTFASEEGESARSAPNWALTPERLDLDLAAKPLVALSRPDRAALAAAVSHADIAAASSPTTDARAFAATIKRLLVAASVSLTPAQLKALTAGLSERDETAPIVLDAKGTPIPDTDARDTENVPLSEDVHTYFAREVLPHIPDAWIDDSKTKTGYEIPFTRHFYKYVAPRPLEEIDADLNKLANEIMSLLIEVEA
ncbi:hypothetical protein BH09ACT6_BH09ACT6_17070 [soil metagenome]